jgi:DNA primase
MDLLSWCELNLDDGKQKGHEYQARCPWCGEVGKFSVNIEKQVYRCFRASCDETGWAGKLISHVEGVTLSQARAKLKGGEAEIVMPKFRPRKVLTRELVIPLPDEFIPCYQAGRLGTNGEDKSWRLPLALRNRGIDREVLSRYGAGFCIDGKQYNRVVLPVNCSTIKAWTARDLTDDHKTNKLRPKYYNPPGEWADAAFFGWDEADTGGADLVIAEGPFDVLRLACHGINAIGFLGKELKAEQPRRKLLYEIPRGTSITIMVDPEVSRLDIQRIAAMIPRRHRVYVANLLDGVTEEGITDEQRRDGVDPGNSTREQALAAIDKAQRIR